jgi:hypothetical protein
MINVRNRRKQIGAFVRNREGDVRIRISVTQGGDRRSGQNQIADSLQLQEKNFHPLLTRSGGFQTAVGDLEIVPP